MRMLLMQFLESDTPSAGGPPPKKQILSLGVGFDTTFFQLVVRLMFTGSIGMSKDQLSYFILVSDGHYSLTHFGHLRGSYFNEGNERGLHGCVSGRKKSAALIRGAGLSRGTYYPMCQAQQF